MEASLFLNRLTYTGKNNIQENLESSSGIATLLGELALAITQMASVKNRRQLSFAEFIQLYQEQENLKELPYLDFSTNLRQSPSLTTVWALEDLRPNSTTFLEIIFFFDAYKIPESLL